MTRITTYALDGVTARPVDVQVKILSGQSVFSIVGLADKAVAESRERVRAALAALGLGLPPDRIIVNLAPADLPKEGSHYDLAIALALMAAIGAAPRDMIEESAAFGELNLDGGLMRSPGALPAAIAAVGQGKRFICPAACGAEAAWSGGDILAAPDLMAIVNHMRGVSVLAAPVCGAVHEGADALDLSDVRGQSLGKRAVLIAAAGGHNLLMSGPPGCGKSMLAQRLPGLLAPLEAQEVLELSMIYSVAGVLEKGAVTRARPFRAPHHSASMAAMIGGGVRAKPGEASLAHCGVLFLDELPEFSAQVIDSLRQPLEGGEVMIARANRHVRYPARFQLVAAMNPCKCGAESPAACRRGQRCAEEYQQKLSGPFLDRMDLSVSLHAVAISDLAVQAPARETSGYFRKLAAGARAIGQARGLGVLNARLSIRDIESSAELEPAAAALLARAAEAFQLTARGYHKILRVARTIADLRLTEEFAGAEALETGSTEELAREMAQRVTRVPANALRVVTREDVGEALGFRQNAGGEIQKGGDRAQLRLAKA